MKTLYLFRHGKSSWRDRNLPDFDRPLKQRGIDAAHLIGNHMVSRGMRPDVILCSSAARTQETLKYLQEEMGGEPEVHIDRSLYLAGPNRIIRQLSKISPNIESVMVIGHNPGLQFLAMELTSGAGEARGRLGKKFPTAALAVMTCEQPSWSTIRPGSFTLQEYLTPKTLQLETV